MAQREVAEVSAPSGDHLAAGAPILRTEGLGGGYGRKQVIFDVGVNVRDGEIVAIIGHNGGGKTTTLKTIFGMLPAKSGSIVYRGKDVTRSSCRANVQAGMSLIPAERFVFGDLTVLDNLRLGAAHEPSGSVRRERLERVHEIFPTLAERASQRAGTMSGGQQRMLSLGMALMGGPKLLLLDEPSLGLAPALVADIFSRVRQLATDSGMAVIILEQNVGQVLRIADRVYAMRSGRIFLEETAEQMKAREQYWDLF